MSPKPAPGRSGEGNVREQGAGLPVAVLIELFARLVAPSSAKLTHLARQDQHPTLANFDSNPHLQTYMLVHKNLFTCSSYTAQSRTLLRPLEVKTLITTSSSPQPL